MENTKYYYGVLKLSNNKVSALGCACYCRCSGGDDTGQVTLLSNYMSSSSYR